MEHGSDWLTLTHTPTHTHTHSHTNTHTHAHSHTHSHTQSHALSVPFCVMFHGRHFLHPVTLQNTHQSLLSILCFTIVHQNSCHFLLHFHVTQQPIDHILKTVALLCSENADTQMETSYRVAGHKQPVCNAGPLSEAPPSVSWYSFTFNLDTLTTISFFWWKIISPDEW
jgi:hypothetical protein